MAKREPDCTDVNVMDAIRDEFELDIAGVPTFDTAGDAYAYVVKKLGKKQVAATDPWPRVRDAVAKACGRSPRSIRKDGPLPR